MRVSLLLTLIATLFSVSTPLAAEALKPTSLIQGPNATSRSTRCSTFYCGFPTESFSKLWHYPHCGDPSANCGTQTWFARGLPASVGTISIVPARTTGAKFTKVTVSFKKTARPGSYTFVLGANCTGTTGCGTATVSTVVLNFVPPASESTAFNAWGSGRYATTGGWKQTLFSSTEKYNGLEVEEFVARNGADTCWYVGSAAPPQTKITGGIWPVNASQKWGDDSVGWLQAGVAYYRRNGRAPCKFIFYQQMKIKAYDGKYYNYGVVNTLPGGIGKTRVSSSRAGSSRTRTWP